MKIRVPRDGEQTALYIVRALLDGLDDNTELSFTRRFDNMITRRKTESWGSE